MHDFEALLSHLADLVADRVVAKMRDDEKGSCITGTPGGPQEPALMRKDELAGFLRVSASTLDVYVRQGMPYVQLGGQRRYRMADVSAWLETRTTRVPKPTADDAGPEPMIAGVRLVSGRRRVG